MRAIKHKHALALNLSIVENEEDMIKEAIEQARNISEELDIDVCLTNPYTNKFIILTYWEGIEDEEYYKQLI